MFLNRRKVVCHLSVGGVSLPQVEEFKYPGVLFTSEGRPEREIDRRIGAASVVMRSLYRSVVVKRELSQKAKLSIYRSIFVPTLTNGHKLWFDKKNIVFVPQIMKEVCRALGNAAADDSKLLLLSSVGTVFCSGLDSRISDAVRDFVLAFIHFKKPIVVAVNGPAMGLGASILPLCDVVWASERAWFQTPCAALHLTPSGCSSYTFPQILGVALANEMLFCGRKLTAQEACSRGLVSQVFWPTTFNQEVMLRVKEMALCNVLEESKCLVRSFVMSVLEEVNEKECQILKQLWCSTKGLEALFSYLHSKTYEK
uniref:Chromodomain Y like 2 n=1 Tax=Oryzias latipes TaxID=8090 RepID=A0A3P9KA67_ORYLA